MMTYRIFIVFLCLVSFQIKLNAQPAYYPINHATNNQLSKVLLQSTKNNHTGFRPLLKNKMNVSEAFDSTLQTHEHHQLIDTKKWFWRKLLSESFVLINDGKFHAEINPLFNLEYLIVPDLPDNYTTNTRGIMVNGAFSDKLSFTTKFYENQAFPLPYIDQFVDNHIVMPGQGAAKVFQESGWDFSMASARLSVDFSPAINLTIGHDKHFIGEGYRSLLLSDNSFNYPFVKLQLTTSKVQYISMFTQFQHFADHYYFYHHRRHGNFSYISWLPNERLEISAFEAVIWQTFDEQENNNMNIGFFNPIIFTKAAYLGLNDEHNILLGFQAKFKISTNSLLYGQLMLDNIDFQQLNESYFENKYGFQLGVKMFDLLGNLSPYHQLFVQLEYNQVAPYSYSHAEPLQAYAHFNQALAHPLGAGFRETVAIGNYRFRNFSLRVQYNQSVSSADTAASNNGSNIFLSNESAFGLESDKNTIGQGIRTEIQHTKIELSYRLNPQTSWSIFVGIARRDYVNEIEHTTNDFLFFGMRTNLRNIYYDF